MKASERDDLIIRIDERTNNIWRVLDKQDKKVDQIVEGQSRQNGSIMRNTVWRKVVVSIGGTGLVAFILHLIGVY